MLTITQILLMFFFILTCLAMIKVHGQQNYLGLSSQDCESNDQTGRNSQALLYTCNGENRVCQAFLIFRSKPPYNSVQAISNLTSSDPKELARVNNVTESEVFPTNKEVIVPVDCSCSGQYYQKNTSIILNDSETYYLVANDVLQGLSTCQALIGSNTFGALDLRAGLELKVPLRCACPTKNQTQNGTKFLLTYPLDSGENIWDIGERFNVSPESILYANGISEDSTIFPSTTILIPFSTEPSSSLTITHKNDDTQTATFPPPLLGSNPKGPESKRKLYLVVAITAGCSLLILVVALSAFFLVYKKRSKGLVLPRRATSRKRLSPEDLRVEIASFEKGTLHVYEIEEIKKATQSFSSERQIKGGVFHGVFGEDSATTMAVKRTRKDVTKEVNILKKLNHFNLIKLDGVCKYHDRSYLVFEYMENGSLREWLRGNGSEKNWSWAIRIQIALDIAHGLDYLHSFTKPGYVHKNIKSSNILLDGNMRAKISNFGLAGPAAEMRTTSTSTSTEDHSETTTTSHVVGTRGYVDPEYLATGIVTPKIDVFAFGVVILELMTRENVVAVHNGQQVLLSAKIVEIMKGDDPEADLDLFVDPSLKQDYRYKDFVLRVAKLSVACLKRESESRPSMGEVVSTLSKIQADIHRTELEYV